MGKVKELFQDIVELAEEAILEKDYDSACKDSTLTYLKRKRKLIQD